VTSRTRLALRAVALLAPLTLYAASFFLPAFDTGTGRTLNGWEAFRRALEFGFPALRPPPKTPGWALGTRPGVGWLANPAFFTGIVLAASGRWRLAALPSLAAVALALLWPTWIFAGFNHYLVGYYAWAGSMSLLAATALAGAAVQSRRGKSTPGSSSSWAGS
jgi:hypothetical protein